MGYMGAKISSIWARNLVERYFWISDELSSVFQTYKTDADQSLYPGEWHGNAWMSVFKPLFWDTPIIVSRTNKTLVLNAWEMHWREFFINTYKYRIDVSIFKIPDSDLKVIKNCG